MSTNRTRQHLVPTYHAGLECANTPHLRYLYETMGVLEPHARWRNERGKKKWLLEAYSEGRVRAFASKPPTVCPSCQSYAYTASSVGNQRRRDEEEIINDEEENSTAETKGLKICFHCGDEFEADSAVYLKEREQMFACETVETLYKAAQGEKG